MVPSNKLLLFRLYKQIEMNNSQAILF